jgi:hypothetical protein
MLGGLVVKMLAGFRAELNNLCLAVPVPIGQPMSGSDHQGHQVTLPL